MGHIICVILYRSYYLRNVTLTLTCNPYFSATFHTFKKHSFDFSIIPMLSATFLWFMQHSRVKKFSATSMCPDHTICAIYNGPYFILHITHVPFTMKLFFGDMSPSFQIVTNTFRHQHPSSYIDVARTSVIIPISKQLTMSHSLWVIIYESKFMRHDLWVIIYE